MGFSDIFSEFMSARYGNSEIEVESHLNFARSSSAIHRLIIDNEVVCEESGHVGRKMLRGFVKDASYRKPVLVEIEQGLFRTIYKLKVDGIEYPIRKRP